MLFNMTKKNLESSLYCSRSCRRFHFIFLILLRIYSANVKLKARGLNLARRVTSCGLAELTLASMVVLMLKTTV